MKKYKWMVAVTLGLLIVAGIAYADNSTQEETEAIQSTSPTETKMMRFVNTLPSELSGNTLRSIAEGLASDGYITESITCFKIGISRNVSRAQPEYKQKIMDANLHSLLQSNIYTLATKEQKEEMKRYAFSNVSAGYRKYIEQITRNR